MQKKFGWLLIALSIAAVALFLMQRQRTQVSQSAKSIDPASSQVSAAPELSTEGAKDKATPKSPSADQAETGTGAENDLRANDPIESIEDFEKIFAAIDLFNRVDTAHVVQRLRKSDEKLLATVFKSKLKDSEADSGSARSRIIFLAEAWGSESLLPFWKDLALRETPHFEQEKDAIYSAERTLQSGIILQEMQAAITHLGLLANRNEESLQILEKIVLTPNPDIHSGFVRERAFYALKEANAQAALVALRSLEADDPLRNDLRR